ncbi:MAG: hypothetical protein V4773_11405 [Verrucomicrobiota bacterium]
MKHIYLSPAAPLPCHTAARELAQHLGLPVRSVAAPAALQDGDIALLVGAELERYPAFAGRLAAAQRGMEWEVVADEGGAWVFAGATPRNLCRAVLAWIAHPERERNRVSTYAITERFTMWDNSMNQMYRFSRGFDRRAHIREIARLGFTGIELNRYVGGGYHVKHRRFPNDSYAWYMSYAPALDAFVTSELTRDFYDPAELAANLADLREGVAIAREYGLKPGFVCYEPRGVNEAIFERHPDLRGSRIDHPGRSLQPRYALDIAHPRVLAHYAACIGTLMREVEDLRFFNFWTQDSGAGLPFASKLYFGPNGSYLARTKTMGELTRDFTRAILDAGRAINPEFEVIMHIGWEYNDNERRLITEALPKGVTFSHPHGGATLEPGERGHMPRYLPEDRAAGIEPYASMIVGAGHDPEPIIGLPAPRLLLKKFEWLRELGLTRLMGVEGIFSPPQSPFNVNQELFAELIRGETPDLGVFLRQLASRWCEDDTEAAAALVDAWTLGTEALEAWPRINWYSGGVGRTQGRWLVRPLVPDITKLTDAEREAWTRCLFPLPWDIARSNISFEGGIRFFEDEEFQRVITATDTVVAPRLQQVVALLDRAYIRHPLPVLADQRDRYRGILLCYRSDRNLFVVQTATNDYLLKRGDPVGCRARIREAILAEIENTRAWINALTHSRTTFFRIAEKEETPFVHLTPLEDFKLKLDVMPRHLDDEPGPFLQDLIEPKRRKLAFGAVA